MNRITQLDPSTATGQTRQLLDGVQAKLLTNYVNHVARTVVDFSEVKAGEVAAETCETGACACAH